MNTFLIILLIICLAVQIPVLIFYFLHKKEIDKIAEQEMKKKHPNYPKRAKIRYSVFPLNQYNE